MPAMREVFRDEFSSSGQTVDQAERALAAALACGQRFVRSRLCAAAPASRHEADIDRLP